MWGAAYAALVAALFVRFQDPAAARRTPPIPAPGEPLGLVRLHHALFYVLLVVACPLEAILLGGAPGGRVAGLVLFAAGVALYRRAATALGDALSPLVSPHPGGRLVTAGPYRWVRHPMYVGQLAIAVGAPLTLGCRWAFAVSFAAAAVLFARVRLEENALSRAYAEYDGYRARAKRLVPFVL